MLVVFGRVSLPRWVFSRNEEMWHVTHRRASADKSLAKMLPEQGWCRQEHILDNLSVVQIKDVRGKTLLTSTSKHFKIQKPPCLCQSLLDAVWGGFSDLKSHFCCAENETKIFVYVQMLYMCESVLDSIQTNAQMCKKFCAGTSISWSCKICYWLKVDSSKLTLHEITQNVQ